MDLRQYLDDRAIPITAFAGTIGVSVQAIHRYLNGERIPKREVMDRITRATAGKVQPNDFFSSAEAA
jgi:transcriptional regulator with XRE-family HTH domain